MDQTACCTCATLLSQTPRVIASGSSASSSTFSEKEKQIPLPEDRQLECCGRVICGGCIYTNPRFNTYCPYCQTSSTPSHSSSTSPLPSRFSVLTSRASSVDEPPPYSSTPEAEEVDDTNQPPSYHPHDGASPSYLDEKKNRNKSPDDDTRYQNQGQDEDDDQEPILHFLHHPNDTITSLSLQYNIPPQILRSFNRLIGSDHLLLGRQTILIPRPHHYLSFPSSSLSPVQYDQHQQQFPPQEDKMKNKMTSLSPRPVHGEEEEARRSKIRRWMIACKCPDYDVALIYLSQADYDLDAATENYFADEAWERDHPVPVPSGSGGASSSASASGNAKTSKIRDYHQRRLSKRIPASLLQSSMKW
ncbi:hypothetical protein V8F20_003744 [Naviculisporaceae sp. PSN 640]